MCGGWGGGEVMITLKYSQLITTAIVEITKTRSIIAYSDSQDLEIEKRITDMMNHCLISHFAFFSYKNYYNKDTMKYLRYGPLLIHSPHGQFGVWNLVWDANLSPLN